MDFLVYIETLDFTTHTSYLDTINKDFYHATVFLLKISKLFNNQYYICTSFKDSYKNLLE